MSNEQGWCVVGAASHRSVEMGGGVLVNSVAQAAAAALLSPAKKPQSEMEKYPLDSYGQHPSYQYCILHPCVLTLYQSVVTCDGEEGDWCTAKA